MGSVTHSFIKPTTYTYKYTYMVSVHSSMFRWLATIIRKVKEKVKFIVNVKFFV
jgi:hypothetical protein